MVGIAITVAVYGVVALIVKADDAGVALAANDSPRLLGSLSRALGRALVLGMPGLLTTLSVLGTAAMIWVGGGIIVHGLDGYGFHGLEHVIHDAAVATARAMPMASAAVEWIVSAAGAGVVGLVIGGALIPLVGYVVAPAWKADEARVAEAVNAPLPPARRSEAKPSGGEGSGVGGAANSAKFSARDITRRLR